MRGGKKGHTRSKGCPVLTDRAPLNSLSSTGELLNGVRELSEVSSRAIWLGATACELAHKERDDREDCEHNSDPEEEVERLHESTSEQEDDSNDGDNDKKCVREAITFRGK